MKRLALFNRIGGRIIGVVGAVVLVALLALTMLHVQRQESIILAQNERNLTTVTQSIIQGIKTVMLAGHADIGMEMARRVRSVADVIDLRTLRPNGTEAFRDNATVAAVNRQLGHEAFPPRPKSLPVQVLPASDRRLQRVVRTGRIETFYSESLDGERHLTLLAPVAAQEECQACHAGVRVGAVQGVVELVTSLTHLERDIRRTRIIAGVALAVTVALIMAFIHVMVKRSILDPIRVVTRGVVRAVGGNLTRTVPVPSDDELGRMAHSFNHMIGELRRIYSGLQYEKNKLNTIIRGAREGIVVTDGGQRVVLVNPAAEALLGKTAEDIVAQGFDHLFDDPKAMRRRLARRDADTPPELISYNDRILSVHVARIRAEGKEVIGSAALMRDFTEEWRLQKELERDAITDGLTGLNNRRYFDARLVEELAIARRHNRPMSLFLFDVDHFKSFNDTFGHDTGDRVLRGLAEVTRAQCRAADVTCRYGGEEFVVILPSTPLENARAVAERLRMAVAETDIAGHRVTISVGLATYPDHGTANADGLLKAADDALYEAKRGGRNRVCTAAPILSI